MQNATTPRAVDVTRGSARVRKPRVQQMAAPDAFAARFQEGHCPPRIHPGDFLQVARAVGIDPTGGTVVNVGAAMGHPGVRHAKTANSDLAWKFFLDHPELQLRSLAFEADPPAVEVLRKTLQTMNESVRSRIDMVYDFVNASTIVDVLRKHNVPRKFLLLKLDIDSIEFPVFAAIVAHFEPQLVLTEVVRDTWLGNPMRWTALAPLRDQARPALYSKNPLRMTYQAALGNFGCYGATPAWWVDHAPRLGYEALLRAPLVRTGQLGPKDLLLIQRRRRRHHLPPAAYNFSCFVDVKQQSWPSPWAATFRAIDDSCQQVDTPYTIEHEGVCCPKEVDGRPTGLSDWCRCGDIEFADKTEPGG